MSPDLPDAESRSASDHRQISHIPENKHDFGNLSIAAFLESDPRPTFVIDKTNNSQAGHLDPIYFNNAIKAIPKLLQALPFSGPPDAVRQTTTTTSIPFIEWARQLSESSSRIASTISHVGHVWTGFVVSSRWVVISGDASPKENQTSTVPHRNEDPSQAAEKKKKKKKSEKAAESQPMHFPKHLGATRPEKHADEAKISFTSVGSPDWTVASPVGELSPHLKFARSIDWTSTPLGDMTTWSCEFRQLCNHLMANPHPAAIFYGPDLTVLYNEAYALHAAGQRHPGLFGTGFSGFYSEIWDMLKPTFDDCLHEAKSVSVESQMLPIERNGFLEETFYTWSLTPLFGGTDQVMGFYNAPFETTRSVRRARALSTLVRVTEETQLAVRLASFWPSILNALQDNKFDFPFALIYSVEDALAADTENITTNSINPERSSLSGHCVLEGTLGVPDDHPAAPPRLDIGSTNEAFAPYFRQALRTLEPTLVNLEDGSFDKSLLEGVEWRGFEEPCREVVVCPIHPFSGKTVMGFLCVGVNPRRPYDEDYESFIELINQQLATSLAAVNLLEAEIQRDLTAAEVAAVGRSRLSEELALQRSRLQRIAEVSPVGMFEIDASGTLLEANERWHEITNHRLETYYPLSWAEPFVAGPALDTAWHRLSVDRKSWSGELQLKGKRYDTARKDNLEIWVLAAAQPETIDGEYRGILGAITDISTLKWAENIRNRQLKEMEETRRAQNDFIDITSHEMRNPLSAIIQCADGITLALQDLVSVLPVGPQADAIKESIASAETIQLCAMYQKHIVDDILTISKLDSALLVISPVDVQPVLLVKQAMQMFYHETYKVHDIQLDFHVGKSYRDLNVTRVMLDSSRLLQILINLMTNAIKFTKTSDQRRIDVSINAYCSPPAEDSIAFDYFPTKIGRAPSDVTAGSEWGNGEVLFLRFAVKDSGCGLTREEKKKLFHRFQQASPRTHVQYGGSGLGLFISRQLVELQGGEIGIESEAGVGSEFAFYVRCRRSEEMIDPEKISQQMSSETQPAASSVVDGSKKSENIETLPINLTAPDKKSGMLAAKSRTSTSDPQNWHILIVEDNLVNQGILAQQLRKHGCTIYVANHGEEALGIIKQSKAYRGKEETGHELSVVLMDLEMPVMDGLTAVKAIRELEVEGKLVVRLPVIAVSANARVEQIATAKQSGMDSVVSKPFRVKELLPKIEELVSKR